MSRLTHMHKGYGVLNEFKDPCEAITKLAEYEDTGLTPERCAELAKAEREGRLVVLPRKIDAFVDAFETLPRCSRSDLGLTTGAAHCEKSCFDCVCDELARESAEAAPQGKDGAHE